MAKPLGNRFMQAVLSSPVYWILGKGMAVITVHGRKTGREISTPINVIQAEDQFTVISSKDRTWWRNLRGGAQARLHYEGKDFNVKGDVIEMNKEVMNAFNQIFLVNPIFIKYFKIRKNIDGSLNVEDLLKISNERIVIYLQII